MKIYGRRETERAPEILWLIFSGRGQLLILINSEKNKLVFKLQMHQFICRSLVLPSPRVNSLNQLIVDLQVASFLDKLHQSLKLTGKV